MPPYAPIQCDHERVPIKYNYFIRRTKSNRFPVYNETGRGGNLQITQIQRVEGDPRVQNYGVLLIIGIATGIREEFGSAVGQDKL